MTLPRLIFPVLALCGCATATPPPLPDLAPCPDLPNTVCWTSVTRPTPEAQQRADAERQLANERRATSAALVEAERTACADVAEPDRDLSLFDHTEDIVEVSPLKDYDFGARIPHAQLVGAVIAFRAVRGLTAQRLEQIVRCHLARDAAVKDALPDGPLVLEGVEAHVVPDGPRFNLELRSTRTATAKELLARAQQLTASR